MKNYNHILNSKDAGSERNTCLFYVSVLTYILQERLANVNVKRPLALLSHGITSHSFNPNDYLNSRNSTIYGYYNNRIFE